MAALDADFTPVHEVHVEFNELVLPDGKHIPVQTSVTPGSGENDEFRHRRESESEKGRERHRFGESEGCPRADAARVGRGDAASEATGKNAPHQSTPRFLNFPPTRSILTRAQSYFAELQDPLEFGSEPLTPQLASSLASPPPDGSFVHARLVTALSSTTARKRKGCGSDCFPGLSFLMEIT